MKLPVRRISLVTILLAAAAALLPSAASASTISSNWAGHVAGLRKAHGRFASVSGTWVVPAATCSTGSAAYSAVWVGLGGYREGAKGLEQLGTEQDCSRSGDASYDAWFEILPASPVAIHVRVRPGDTVTASSTVRGNAVTFRLRNLTTGAHFATTRHASATDVSSAEWIVEAPSVCTSSEACSSLPLAKIGTVAFASATARSGAQTHPAGYAGWSDTTIELEQTSVSRPAGAEVRSAPEQTLVSAAPSPAEPPYGAFSVSLSEQTSELAAPSRPTLPGFGPA